MYFLSVRKSPTIVLEQIKTIWRGSPGAEVPELTRRRAVHFKPLSEPIPCEGLPGRKSSAGRSVAEGILSVEDAARESGLDQQEVVSRLLQHRGHGVDFIYVDESGKTAAQPQPTAVTGNEPEEDFYDGCERLPTGGYRCIPCDQHFEDLRGLRGHIRMGSKPGRAHALKFEAWQASQRLPDHKEVATA